jgi:hypothetical protein
LGDEVEQPHQRAFFVLVGLAVPVAATFKLGKQGERLWRDPRPRGGTLTMVSLDQADGRDARASARRTGS